ncbi:MAG: DUF2461 domain-containing protein [Pelagimonas sp.]|uniref:DUF2461 domain-containing protein n=1 Tax=Pelagimonas sp. TaxID=2073170 RepID=UPI003D6B3D85
MSATVETKNLFDDSRAFLAELEANNNRDWFHEHKSRCDALLKRPAEKLSHDMGAWFDETKGVTPKAKVFRPHRDVRFSKDKTPYHTHLHVLWSLPDGRSWMLGLSTSYATVGGGVMSFEKSQLDRYRSAVDADKDKELSTLLQAGGWRLDEPALKRVPAPYPSNHPHETLLRCKGLVAWRDDLEEALAADPMQALQTAFREMNPLHDWLGRALNEARPD